MSSIFDRSGHAALSDLKTSEWHSVFRDLEEMQREFLNLEHCFRSAEYRWPRDPLHTWSRVWEYPYAYHHLRSLRLQKTDPRLLRVADLGSGVTFFPFAVARLGCEVTCADIDPLCETDLNRAISHMSQDPGRVSFRRVESELLPFSDEECDAIYCISVLEHVPNPSGLAQEMFRCLKPGGRLLLTLDLDLRGNADLGVEQYRQLASLLTTRFGWTYPPTSVHPADLLTSSRAPFRFGGPKGVVRLAHLAKEYLAKPLIGRPPEPPRDLTLAVEGLALERRSGNDPTL
jgi:2-polyprenyl-3-methyl-5-hydroxy-6-metoxy-1,4-benzoquinol methylase